MIKKYLAELFGTFVLVFCGTGAIILSNETNAVSDFGIALTFGLSVFAMILLFGKISGAHINPAVTIALTISKHSPLRVLLPYITFQIFGAILASLSLKILAPGNVLLGSTMPSGSELESFLLEIVMTFILVLTIYVIPDKANKKINVSAIAVSMVVGLEAFFGGPISGASMNPARSIGPAIVSGHLEHIWIYVLAPIMGASLAAFIARVVMKKSGY